MQQENIHIISMVFFLFPFVFKKHNSFEALSKFWTFHVGTLPGTGVFLSYQIKQIFSAKCFVFFFDLFYRLLVCSTIRSTSQFLFL